jgi:hypothetical protein
VELGLFIASLFQQGNLSPQAGIVDFIGQCLKNAPGTFSTVRIDSAGFNHYVINYCFEKGHLFTITADHNPVVMDAIHRIPENEWNKGINEDGSAALYEVAETVYTMQATT